MERQFVQENAGQRERLRLLVETLSEDQLRITLPNGWPICCALAHLAFWDQRTILRLRKWEREGISQSPADFHVINDALVPLLLAIPPRHAAALAIETAEIVDRILENAPDDLIASIEALGDRSRLYRAVHRKMHLDKIEAAVKGS